MSKEFFVYPHQEINQGYANEPINRGVSLRDYFAGQAIIGILSGKVWNEYNIADPATEAYKIADSMIVCREIQEATE